MNNMSWRCLVGNTEARLAPGSVQLYSCTVHIYMYMNIEDENKETDNSFFHTDIYSFNILED